MGVFGKSNKKSKQSNGTTIIAQGTTIKGGVDVQGSIFIDGRFEGVIVASENVTIGKTGEVLGEIRTKNLTVSGFIDGLFDADNIHVLSTGRIIGRIQYEELMIEQNGIFEGEGKKKNSTISSKYNTLDMKETYHIEH